MGKKIMKDVMLNGGSEINIIIKQLQNKLRLPKPKLAHDLNMADQLTTIKPIDLIQNMRILVHGKPYVVTFIVL